MWHARVVKARSSAAALVEAGHVRINGVRETAPGHAVRCGDVLTIGRAADQAIFLPDLRAALNHARVTLLSSGQYKV